jgi:hypothetical protein
LYQWCKQLVEEEQASLSGQLALDCRVGGDPPEAGTGSHSPGASLRRMEMELTDLTPFCYHWQTEQARRMVLGKQEEIA